MNEPNPHPSSISADEQRLIRLFRCLDEDARSEVLQRLGKRLMMEAAMDSWLRSDEKPCQAASEELSEGIDDRLRRLWPIHSTLLDLLDYDFDVTQYGWHEAAFSIAEVILGSGYNDHDFADRLVEAYVEGSNKYDVPLPCDFVEPEQNREEAVEEMRQELHGEALRFIQSWRENVIRRFEQAP